MWVKANPKASLKSEGGQGFMAKHGGKIKTGLKIAGALAGAALLAKGAHSAHKNRESIKGALSSAKAAWGRSSGTGMNLKGRLEHAKLNAKEGRDEGRSKDAARNAPVEGPRRANLLDRAKARISDARSSRQARKASEGPKTTGFMAGLRHASTNVSKVHNYAKTSGMRK
jgi:hypothetical protein